MTVNKTAANQALIDSILVGIRKANWNKEDLALLRASYLGALQRYQADVRESIEVGSMAKFRSRSGETITGKVIRVNRKTATVLVDKMKWRVAVQLLEPA